MSIGSAITLPASAVNEPAVVMANALTSAYAAITTTNMQAITFNDPVAAIAVTGWADATFSTMYLECADVTRLQFEVWTSALPSLLQGVETPDAFAEIDANLARDARLEADRALEELSGDLGKAVSSRLHELITLAEEESSPASLPSAQSFRALVDFLMQNRAFVEPATTLDDEGMVWAEWRKSPDCAVALRFLADGTIRWVIVSPAPIRKSGRVVWRGDGGVDDIRAAIHARPAVRWIDRSLLK